MFKNLFYPVLFISPALSPASFPTQINMPHYPKKAKYSKKWENVIQVQKKKN